MFSQPQMLPVTERMSPDKLQNWAIQGSTVHSFGFGQGPATKGPFDPVVWFGPNGQEANQWRKIDMGFLQSHSHEVPPIQDKTLDVTLQRTLAEYSERRTVS
jgi:hypothetical protein